MDSHTLRSDLDPRRIAGFVLERRHKDGGFGLAPSVPPSIQDTYYALNILETLKDLSGCNQGYHPDQDRELKSYLKQVELRKGVSPKLLYYYLYSCHVAGLRMEGLKEYLSSKGEAVPLEDRYYIKRIKENLQDLEMEGFRVGVLSHEWKTSKELWMWLYIKGRPGNKIISDILEWISSCQNPDGGFGFLPNTTSFIENTCFCLRSLLFLGKQTKDINRSLKFILSCYTGKGGFARNNGGTPRLDATYYAIQALKDYYLLCE